MSRSTPLFALAFRPFFLFGSLFVVVILAVWVGYQLSLNNLPPYFEGTLWHAHEMLFGFVTAILAGFLLTASKNWANTRGVHGGQLLFLFLLWVAGRASIQFSSFLSRELVAVVDLAFLPCLSLLLWRTLAQGAKKTNFIFVLWLGVLFVANLLMHLETLEWTTQTARVGYLLGVDTVVVIMVLIGGRVIPMFTQNAVPGIKVVKQAWLEKLVLLASVAYLISDLVDETSRITAGSAICAGLASVIRLLGWKPLSTKGRPILWVLHVGYVFLAFGLILRGLAISIFPMAASIPIHLLTAGAMGMLILGMISRVSLGHTGRPIIASRPIEVAYVLVAIGALIRVGGPLFLPRFFIGEIVAAALLWVVAFATFAVIYWPILTQSRADGLEG